MEDDQTRRARIIIMRAVDHLRPQDFQPWNEARPLGCTLQEALTALVPVGVRGMVSSYLARVSAGIEEPNAIARMQAWLWQVLREQLRLGHLTARGRPMGALQSEVLPADLFDEAEPDFGANRLASDAGMISGLRVFSSPPPLSREMLEQMPAAPPTSTHVSSQKRLDYRTADAPLIAEMDVLIRSGNATGPMDAARAVAGKAVGAGKIESKVKRLQLHYEQLRGQTGQTGQN